MIEEKNEKKNEQKTGGRKLYGRPPKLNPKIHSVRVRFDDDEWLRFLKMYEESKVYAKAVFLKAHFFGKKFHVLKVDRTLYEYYAMLSGFHSQYRLVGSNYNQVVKELRSHFSEKKALALLYKLEKCTMELVSITREVVKLTQEYKEMREARAKKQARTAVPARQNKRLAQQWITAFPA